MSCQEYLLRGVYTTISTVCRQRVLHIEGGSNLYSIDSSMFRSGSDSEVQEGLLQAVCYGWQQELFDCDLFSLGFPTNKMCYGVSDKQ